MSEENVEAPNRGDLRQAVLIRYRVVQGLIDQRLTVFDGGAVELDERHRSRDATWLELEEAELRQLNSALERLPARCWSRLPKLMMVRARASVRDVFNELASPDRLFELRRGRRSVAGDVLDPADEVAKLVEPLDALRVHAIRRAEALEAAGLSE